MDLQPNKLELLGPDRLRIEWSDGQRREYHVRDLRDQCPCATCREKRQQDKTQPSTLLPVLSPEETRPLTITAMNPIGNYAYGITFSDGHNTGIFSLELLRQLGDVVEP